MDPQPHADRWRGRAWRTWTACCARCGDLLTVHQDCRRGAEPAFRAAGWSQRTAGGWTCPACKPAARPGAALPAGAQHGQLHLLLRATRRDDAL